MASSSQSQSGSHTANISPPNNRYENVEIVENTTQEDPFEGFEEAIKNSEVIKIKTVSKRISCKSIIYCLLISIVLAIKR